MSKQEHVVMVLQHWEVIILSCDCGARCEVGYGLSLVEATAWASDHGRRPEHAWAWAE